MNEPADIDPPRHARVGKRVAREIALIAAILAFAWMRPTAREALRARLIALAARACAPLSVGMNEEELTRAVWALPWVAVEFAFEDEVAEGVGAWTLVVRDSPPELSLGLWRAMYTPTVPTVAWLSPSARVHLITNRDRRLTHVSGWLMDGKAARHLPPIPLAGSVVSK